jgi:ABC-type spermidine/putrescine transport system permease subunit I
LRNRPWVGFAMSLPPILFMAGFIGVPIALALAYSLGDLSAANTATVELALHQIRALHGITLGVYSELLRSSLFLEDLWATVWITVVTVAVVIALAWGISLYMTFNQGVMSRILGLLYIVPMFIPVVIASYALVSFYNQGGWLSSVFTLLGMPNAQMPSYTGVGILIGQIWTSISFAVLMISAGLKAIPSSHLEAAKDIGASRLSTVWNVLVPQNLLSTTIATAFTAIGVLGSFTVPYLMGPNSPQMLGVAMYNYFSEYGEPQQAQAMAIMLFVMALGVAYVYIRANLMQERTVR